MRKLDLSIPIQLPEGKKVYFASDFHLGAPNAEVSQVREKAVVRWLEEVQKDAHVIFLVGDLFDFWFEYRSVIPKGFLHFQGQLKRLAEQGQQLVFFTGNHDMWMFDYFEQELGVPIVRHPITLQINDACFHIGHGDGLGPGDRFYKLVKLGFSSRICQWLFSWIHPDIGMQLARLWSKKSRSQNEKKDELFRGPEFEWIYQYCREVEANQHHDYYVFGHRHLPLDIPVNPDSRYFNLGEWITQQSYGVFDGLQFELQTFRG